MFNKLNHFIYKFIYFKIYISLDFYYFIILTSSNSINTIHFMYIFTQQNALKSLPSNNPLAALRHHYFYTHSITFKPLCVGVSTCMVWCLPQTSSTCVAPQNPTNIYVHGKPHHATAHCTTHHITHRSPGAMAEVGPQSRIRSRTHRPEPKALWEKI